MTADTLDTNLLRTKRQQKPAEPDAPPVPKSPRRQLLKSVAYVVIFLAALLFFVYLKTPAALVQGVVLNALNQGGQMQWQADSIQSKLLLLPHIEAKNLSVAPTRPGAGLPPMQFSELNIYPRFLSLIPWTGKMNPSFGFSGSAYKATFDGSATADGSSLVLNAEKVNFEELLPLLEAGIHLKGVIETIEADLAMSGGRLSQASGTVTAKGKNFVVDPAALSIPFPLPILDLGVLDLSAKATNGRLQIERLSLGTPGKDLEVRGTGSIQLQDNINFSRMELRLRLKPSAKILGAMPSLKAMLETISAPQPDGFYAMKLSGPLGQPGLPQPDR